MHKTILWSAVGVSILALTACGTKNPPYINVPKLTDVKSMKIIGGLPGSSWAALTQSQEEKVLAMLGTAKDTGYGTSNPLGYPHVLIIQLPRGRIITISPAMTIRKSYNTITGIPSKNVIDFFDSNDKSKKPQVLNSPYLYELVTNWTAMIPKSQWHTER